MKPNVQYFACNTYSYTLTQTAETCLAHLADFGFSEFELMMYPGHLWPPDADATQRVALRRLIESRDLRVVTLNMPNIDMNIAGASPKCDATRSICYTWGVELAGGSSRGSCRRSRKIQPAVSGTTRAAGRFSFPRLTTCFNRRKGRYPDCGSRTCHLRSFLTRTG